MKPNLCGMLLACVAACNLVFAQWDSYPTYAGYLAIMNKFQVDYPQVCKIHELGQSVQGRKLLAAKISDSVNSGEKEPAFLYHAAIHGDEVLGYVLMLRLIDYLLVNYQKDPLVTNLVDHIEIWIAPLVNPDATYKGGESSVVGAIRNNANGKDLNRNWPCWCLQDNHKFGTYDAFEPEVKALKELIDARNFVLSADIHSGDEKIIYTNMQTHKVDEPWWVYVCKLYADSASGMNPNYILELKGDASEMYETHGQWPYYPFIYRHFRNITLELTTVKMLSASQLGAYWNYNYKSLLNYMQQTLFGIRGTVTDSATGQALAARVFVEQHDIDSSIVYARLPYGDYYRPIIQGTYSVTFSANGYLPKTVTGVKVTNNAATELDVQLAKDQTGVIVSNTISAPEFTISTNRGQVAFSMIGGTSSEVHMSLFDMSGRLVRTLVPASVSEKMVAQWDGSDTNGKSVANGCYIIRVQSGNSFIGRRFTYTR